MAEKKENKIQSSSSSASIVSESSKGGQHSVVARSNHSSENELESGGRCLVNTIITIFYAAVFFLFAFVLLQNFDPLLCAIVSCLYPAYETTRSLSARKNSSHKQRKHWLIYWIVFSFFTLQDYYTEWLTKLFSPFLLLKMLFLMLLALPQTGVAELCHYNIVVPMLSVVKDAFVKYNHVGVDVMGRLATAVMKGYSSVNFSSDYEVNQLPLTLKQNDSIAFGVFHEK
uniref:Receptor expression-enhancing protein n=1 Tax=Setaria digitata TaxID=48799 RepID=A0A915PNH3_9BILA